MAVTIEEVKNFLSISGCKFNLHSLKRGGGKIRALIKTPEKDWWAFLLFLSRFDYFGVEFYCNPIVGHEFETEVFFPLSFFKEGK